MGVRQLVICLGDQLNADAAVFDNFEADRDTVWMAEVPREATHVWSHKARIALFMAAMRHFAQRLENAGLPVDYQRLDGHDHESLGEALGAALAHWQPERVLVTQPGDHRVLEELREAAAQHGYRLVIVRDHAFFDSPERFRIWARGHKQLRLESYYRRMRRDFGVLMDGDEPCGGVWNLDTENRKAFGRQGPGDIPAPEPFAPDAITREAMAAVEARYPDHPGAMDGFDWPVTPEQAETALADFVAYRLPEFGRYQDALWTDEPWLYHSRLSAAMNLKLLSPQRVVAAVEQAWRDGTVPLASAEGFIRQVLGWREYVRGIYWLYMPEYLEHNALEAQAPLPDFFWTGNTEMACLGQALGQTLDRGYAHHIQRLMITGLYTMMLGVEPRQVHEWYLAVYVDAVEWVEAPNTLGMAQFADGGIMASKPYCATGKYIKRMSNYCRQCPFDPEKRSGDDACPFTSLYWDFLMRHEDRLRANPRTALQARNLGRLSTEEREAIAATAAAHRRRVLPSGDPGAPR
ncbi:MAG: cryptochrome/photolyase family protein [Ectothiorhodospiraceae bacterium]